MNETIKTREQMEKIKDEIKNNVRSVELIGKDTIRFKVELYKYDTYNRVRKKVDSKIVDIKSEEVSKEELMAIRLSKIPYIIFKEEDHYYVAELQGIVKEISADNTIHKCSNIKTTCDRLLALSYEDGGCEKVRDRVKFIEKYHWIKKGYQTINTSNNLIVVIDCSRCEPTLNVRI